MNGSLYFNYRLGLNEWHSVAYVSDGGKQKTYIDGSLVKRLPRKMKKKLKKAVSIGGDYRDNKWYPVIYKPMGLNMPLPAEHFPPTKN